MEQCPFEEEVIEAVGSNSWTDALRAHAASCPTCNPTARVTAALGEFASTQAAANEITVSYRTLWFRAQFARHEKRLSIVDLVLSLGSLGIAISGFVGIIIWDWSAISAWFGGISPGMSPQLPFLIIAGCGALLWILTDEVFSSDR